MSKFKVGDYVSRAESSYEDMDVIEFHKYVGNYHRALDSFLINKKPQKIVARATCECCFILESGAAIRHDFIKLKPNIKNLGTRKAL